MNEILDISYTQSSVCLRLQTLLNLILRTVKTVRACTGLFSAHITCTAALVPVQVTDYIAILFLYFLIYFNYNNI